MKNKIFITGLVLVLALPAFAQKGKFELELTTNLSMENNVGNYGIIGSAGMNYYFIDRIGLNTNIGGFQSFIAWEDHNSSLFKWDADVFFDVVHTQKDHRLRLSAGVSWFRGATSYVSGSQGSEAIAYDVEFHNGIGVNGKIQYRLPVAEKWYLGINGEVYWLSSFSYPVTPALGVTFGYKF